jgi:PKD repeat protein
MNPRRQYLTSLVVLLLLLLCWAPASFAFYAPLQNVTASANGSTINYSVYDPSLGKQVAGSYNASGTVSGLTVQEGIVSCVIGSVNPFLAVYDPGRESWEIYNPQLPPIDAIDSIIIKNGMAVLKSGMLYASLYIVQYDALKGGWASVIYGNYLTANKSGVVIYRYDSDLGYGYPNGYVIYDPTRGTFEGEQVAMGATSFAISDNGTVTYTLNGVNYTRGYDATAGTWYAGQTKTQAAFAAQPAVSNGVVWVTDMSIGAIAWNYDFGDGTPSSGQRSPYHTYANEGTYTVSQTAFGPAGSSSTSHTVKIDKTSPTGTISINGGLSYTNSLGVTLQLSASDLLAGVSGMRFSANGVTWRATWTPYATTAPYTLPVGDGQKTVYAQFQDTAGNISSTYSATIILDTTPPLDGNLTATAMGKQVNLSWSGFSDALSGINNYRLYYSTKPFTNLADATKIYDGLALSYPHTGLLTGQTYYYRLCAVDKAGNVSPGAAANARIAGGALPFLEMLLH